MFDRNMSVCPRCGSGNILEHVGTKNAGCLSILCYGLLACMHTGHWVDCSGIPVNREEKQANLSFDMQKLFQTLDSQPEPKTGLNHIHNRRSSDNPHTCVDFRLNISKMGDMNMNEYWNWPDGVYLSPPHDGNGQKWQPVMTEVIERHADVEFEDFDDCKNFCYDSGWIYFRYDRGFDGDIFYRMRPDGSEIEKIYEFPGSLEVEIRNIRSVEDGWIYYELWHRGKETDYKMRIDGTELQEVEET